MRYADVIVDITAQGVDRLFTYACGDDLTIGQRVLVPFGNRRTEGYVMDLKGECDLAPEKIKPVLRTLESYPAFTQEQLRLAKWMQARYRSTLCDALRLMIPSEMRGERVRVKALKIVSLTETGEKTLHEEMQKRARFPRQLRLLQMLQDGAKPMPILSQEIDGVQGGVSSLEKQGLVCVEESEARRKPYANAEPSEAIDLTMTPHQQRAAEALIDALDTGGGKFLLYGVTGSGKTEVYIRLIRKALSEEKTAIVLAPEIALTPQMVDWFRARFGDDSAVLHSRLSAGERFDEWLRIMRGEARVVIGARSAVFAPLKNIGAIIVDEEHEHTYRSEKRPRYDAREAAAWRTREAGAVLVLGSATPSLSSFMRTMPRVRPENKLTLLEMPYRANGRDLPKVEIVDMRTELVRGNLSIFSGKMRQALIETIDAGEQAILFINRRGYSTYVSCRMCGYVEKCESCDVAMTYHMAEGLLRCHYCDAVRKPPDVCPQCGSGSIKYFGTGTQKVEDEVRRLLPNVRTARMDVDTTRGKDSHERILSAFRRGETKILIGTQMIAKGLDFPNVTLVGVVMADMTLNLPDYRGAERTFQLLTQVEGRAGRAEKEGRVIVQSYEPEHYAIELAARQDYRAFYTQEVKYRRRGLYPPFTILARILTASPDPIAAQETAAAYEEKMNAFLDANEEFRKDVVQMRALEAPIGMIRGEYRHQVFIKIYAKGAAEEILTYMENLTNERPDSVRAELEVNPVNMF